jgi:hypothetical protein
VNEVADRSQTLRFARQSFNDQGHHHAEDQAPFSRNCDLTVEGLLAPRRKNLSYLYKVCSEMITL